MIAYDFVHLVLLAIGGRIEGRTKLQKTVYFVGTLSRKLPELGYRPHFYGPYSDLVAGGVNRLKALGFLQETSLHTGAINSAGFEIARHDFELTQEGKRIALEKSQRYAAEWALLQKSTRLLQAAGDIDYMQMSVAAKAYFILSEKGTVASVQELSESAKRFGWNPSASEIHLSIGFLKRLNLVVPKER